MQRYSPCICSVQLHCSVLGFVYFTFLTNFAVTQAYHLLNIFEALAIFQRIFLFLYARPSGSAQEISKRTRRPRGSPSRRQFFALLPSWSITWSYLPLSHLNPIGAFRTSHLHPHLSAAPFTGPFHRGLCNHVHVLCMTSVGLFVPFLWPWTTAGLKVKPQV